MSVYTSGVINQITRLYSHLMLKHRTYAQHLGHTHSPTQCLSTTLRLQNEAYISKQLLHVKTVMVHLMA